MKKVGRILIAWLMLLTLWAPAVTLAQTTDVPEAQIVKFRGVILSRPEETTIGDWQIGEETVAVVEETQMIETNGPAVVGTAVTVIAKKLADESLEALVIRVEKLQDGDVFYLRGRISALGTDWLVVNRWRVQYNEETHIRGELQVGAMVSMQVRMEAGKWSDVVRQPAQDIDADGSIERAQVVPSGDYYLLCYMATKDSGENVVYRFRVSPNARSWLAQGPPDFVPAGAESYGGLAVVYTAEGARLFYYEEREDGSRQIRTAFCPKSAYRATP